MWPIGFFLRDGWFRQCRTDLDFRSTCCDFDSRKCHLFVWYSTNAQPEHLVKEHRCLLAFPIHKPNDSQLQTELKMMRNLLWIRCCFDCAFQSKKHSADTPNPLQDVPRSFQRYWKRSEGPWWKHLKHVLERSVEALGDLGRVFALEDIFEVISHPS